MTTKEVIKNYFTALHAGGWESYIADNITFANLGNISHDKATYVHDAGRFFKLTTAVTIRELIVDGDKAAVLARYIIRSPKGSTGTCDVAEFLTVTDGRLLSSAIFFDPKALAEFMAQ